MCIGASGARVAFLTHAIAHTVTRPKEEQPHSLEADTEELAEALYPASMQISFPFVELS